MEWLQAFLAQLPQTELEPDESRTRLQAILASAAEGWPAFSRDDVGFAEYLGVRVADEMEPLVSLEKRHHEDLYLAFHVVKGTAEAVAAFDRMCDGAIAAAVRRMEGSPSFVEEVQQAVRVKLLVPNAGATPRLGNYRGTGKLRSWVQVVAVRIALELFRKRHPNHAGEEALVDVADVHDDPELTHIKGLYRKEFRTAFHAALSTLSSRERNMLRMVLIDGLSITDLAELYRVHRSTASRQLATAREKLMDETRDKLREALELSPEQFYSLLNTIRSHLDLSLENVL